MPPVTKMKFMAYVITGLCFFKCFGTCSEAVLNDDSYKEFSGVESKSIHERAEVFTENSNFSNITDSSFEYIVEQEPVLSDPLFENPSWNISDVVKSHSRRHVTDVPEGRLTFDNRMRILQLHNIYRGTVNPPAGNMAFMEWDEELASLAQIWVDGCVFDHGMPPNNYSELIGQNLYIGTDPTGDLGLRLWFEEHRFYDFKKDVCLPNKQCGHYKQMVWSESTKLGCAMTKCEMRYFLACHYAKSALKGVPIYLTGKPCSQCSSKNGALCIQNLCLTWDQCENNPFDCKYAECDLECHNCGRLNKKKCLCECADGWDSPDCSRLCLDKHPRCGKNPGWPSKKFCSLTKHAVAESFCRKMCEMCLPLPRNISSSNNTCCNGKLCEDGYVLDTQKESCTCSSLCPGPICDKGEDEKEAELPISLQATGDAPLTAIPATMSWLIIIWLVKVLRRTEI